MCGHVGIAGKLEAKDEATLKRMLVFDYFRGPDSTGFAALRGNKDILMAKVASHPVDLFEMGKFKNALSGFHSTVFLGHNRLATKGAVTGVNAHPYMFPKEGGHIVGAHNGTLIKEDWDKLQDNLGDKYDVDSMALIAHLAKFGVDDTVKCLTQGKGTHDGSAWALVWFDTSDNTLNFIRNNQRPFWYAYTKNFDHLFWASEHPTIRASLELSLNPYEMYKTPEGYSYFSTKENWWYRIDIDKLKAGGEERPKFRVKEVVGKEPTPAQSYCGGYTPFKHKSKGMSNTGTSTTHSPGGSSGSNVLAIPDHTKTTTSPSLLTLVTPASKPYAEYLTQQEFNDIAKYGCSWCQADVFWDQAGVQVFKSHDMILCPSCADEGDVNRVYVNATSMG